MAFSFAFAYRPSYQKRYGKCAVCLQGIENGEQIMMGYGYFNHHLIRTHSHFECWLTELQLRAKNWFFANDYIQKRMSDEQRAELNRLRTKRNYIQNKGGDQDVIAEKVGEINETIALVKSKNNW